MLSVLLIRTGIVKSPAHLLSPCGMLLTQMSFPSGAHKGRYFATSVIQHCPSPHPDLPPPRGKGPLPTLMSPRRGRGQTVRGKDLPPTCVPNCFDPPMPPLRREGVSRLGRTGAGRFVGNAQPSGRGSGCISQAQLTRSWSLSTMPEGDGETPRGRTALAPPRCGPKPRVPRR
jgi:hypothetical protein